MSNTIDFLGLPLAAGMGGEDVCRLIGERERARLVTFINPYAWALARQDPAYLPALKAMDYVLPDGQGVVLACRAITGQRCVRVSFDMTSLADRFFKAASAAQASVFLAGGRPGVDEDVQLKLLNYYPDLKVAGTIHGFGEFSAMVAAVMEKKPDIVIAGMGAPRQELFLLALREAGYKGLAITCGGFFDQYLQDTQYYPVWIDRLHLRFLWRLIQEPQRLWKRYLIDYQTFVWLAARALLEKNTPPAARAAAVKVYEKIRAQAGAMIKKPSENP